LEHVKAEHEHADVFRNAYEEIKVEAGMNNGDELDYSHIFGTCPVFAPVQP
jgi:hypothetical protein